MQYSELYRTYFKCLNYDAISRLKDLADLAPMHGSATNVPGRMQLSL